MTGPEHYRAAEEIIDDLDELVNLSPKPATVGVAIAVAQVHATLALAAATAADQATAYDGDESYSRSRGWAGVA